MSITTYSTNKLNSFYFKNEQKKESRVSIFSKIEQPVRSSAQISQETRYIKKERSCIFFSTIIRNHFFETTSRTIMWIVRRKRLVQNETTHHDFKYVRKKQVCHYQIPIPFAVQFHRLPTNDPKGTEKSRS